MTKILLACFLCIFFLCGGVSAQEIKRFYPGVYVPIDEPKVYDTYTPMKEPDVYDLPSASETEKGSKETVDIQYSRETETVPDTPAMNENAAGTLSSPETYESEYTSNTREESQYSDYQPVKSTSESGNQGNFVQEKSNTENYDENDGGKNNAVINIDFDSFGDDFDSMFDGASDVTVEDQNIAIGTTVPQNNGLDAVVAQVTNNDTFPIRFSGNLGAEVGFGAIFLDPDKDMEPNFSGFFSFKNYFNVSARPHKSISVRGSIRTLFPSFRFDLEQLYVDVLLFDKLYLTVGRKSTSWGYTRLFGDRQIIDKILLEGNPNNRDERLIPNVLYDSSNYYTAMLRLPLWTGTISALAMYPISGTVPQDINYKDLSYAFSVEMVFLKTSFNLFARLFERPKNINENDIRPHLYGLEVKRTILGADIYMQGMMQAKYISNMGNINGYDVFVVTSGIYRYWDLKNGNRLGGNFEYQYVFLPHNYEKHINQIRFAGGISRIGKKNKIKIAIDLEHNFTDRAGRVELGWQYSDVFPFADWKIGSKFEYGGTFAEMPKITLGTSLNFNINY